MAMFQDAAFRGFKMQVLGRWLPTRGLNQESKSFREVKQRPISSLQSYLLNGTPNERQTRENDIQYVCLSAVNTSLAGLCFRSKHAASVWSPGSGSFGKRRVMSRSAEAASQALCGAQGPLFKVFKPALTGLNCDAFCIFILLFCYFHKEPFHQFSWCFKSNAFPCGPMFWPYIRNVGAERDLLLHGLSRNL